MAFTVFPEPDSHYKDPSKQATASVKESPSHHMHPGSNHARILVGIPALNEEIAIGSITLRSLKYSDSVVVIDDGSTDMTSEVAALAGASVIRHKKNEGKGTSIKDIFTYAKAIQADILVLIDGDGQHNPDDMPRLLDPLLVGEVDMVIGSRFLAGMTNKVPLYRRLGQEALTFATNITSGTRVTDTQSGFRAFSKKAFGCFTFNNNGMAIESEMIIEAARSGLNIKEVPIDVRYDVNGSSLHPVKHGFSVLSKIIKLGINKS
jgi:glycosyltransferase involved in cell wall biosynthesis